MQTPQQAHPQRPPLMQQAGAAGAGYGGGTPQQQYLQQNIRPGGPLQGRRFSNGGQNGYNANQQGPKPFAARDVQDVVAILRSRPNGTAELSSLAPQWHEAALREMATGRPDILRIQDRYITLHGVEVEKKPVADLFEAWHEFRPENSKHGELPLEVGELVTVTEQNASGWWKGIKVKSTGRGGPGPGWFPAAMVESLCGTMKPTGAGGRIAFFEMAASRILKFDPKASRMDVDLAGLHPPLSDDDLVAFAQWLSRRLQSQRDLQISLDVSRNAIGANGLRAFFEMISQLNIVPVALDVSCNPFGDAGLEPICNYVQQTPRQTLKSVNVTGTSLRPQGGILNLMKALTLRPVLGHSVPHLTAPEDGASERLQYIEQEFGVKLMVEESVIGNGPWSS
jgi:hypothetical protein